MTLQVEEVLGVAAKDCKATEANEGRWDPQEKTGLLAPWVQLVLGDSLGGMVYPPPLAPLLLQV